MCGYRKILLQLSANLDNYEIELYSYCDKVRKRITSRFFTLCLCTDAPTLRMVATPLDSAYNTKLYFTIDVASCADIFSYSLRFSREGATPTPVAPINTFTLTDASYGLPIDGSLLFTSV